MKSENCTQSALNVVRAQIINNNYNNKVDLYTASQSKSHYVSQKWSITGSQCNSRWTGV